MSSLEFGPGRREPRQLRQRGFKRIQASLVEIHAGLGPDSFYLDPVFAAMRFEIGAADEALALDDGQDVIAVAPLFLRHVYLDRIVEAEEPPCALSVADRGIEGRKEARRIVRRRKRGDVGFDRGKG